MDKFSVDNWGGYAKCYDALNELGPYVKMQKTAVDSLDLSVSKSILDAACGTGNFEFWLKQKIMPEYVRVYGIDFSEEMLQLAKEKNPEKNFKYQAHDLNTDLPFPENFFDQIVSINTVYAVKYPRKVLSDFYRVLKPGGNLTLVNPRSGYENGLVLKEHSGDCGPDQPWLNAHQSQEKELSLIERAIHDDVARAKMISVAKYNRLLRQEAHKFHFFSQDELRDLLVSHGFKISYSAEVYANQAVFANGQK